MIKTANDFLSLAALKRNTVSVKGQEVHFRELSVSERAKMLEVAKGSPGDAPAWLVATCITDADGKALFDAETAKQVSGLAPEVVDTVASAILDLSGMKESPNA